MTEPAIVILAGAEPGVLHPVAQDEGRDAGVVGLERDERIEGFERDLERDLAVGELDLGEGVFALEAGLLHARQAGHEDAAEAETGREGRLERALEDADELLAGLLEVEGEEGEGHVDALAGPVEDLPVAEVAAAAERDRARADAAEREGDLVERPRPRRSGPDRGEELVAAIGGRCRLACAISHGKGGQERIARRTDKVRVRGSGSSWLALLEDGIGKPVTLSKGTIRESQSPQSRAPEGRRDHPVIDRPRRSRSVSIFRSMSP